MTAPVTALAEGFDPPRMSCIKKVSVWSGPSTGTTPVVPVVVVEAGLGGMAPKGVTSSASGAATGIAVSGSSVRVRAAVVNENVVDRRRRESSERQVNVDVAMVNYRS